MTSSMVAYTVLNKYVRKSKIQAMKVVLKQNLRLVIADFGSIIAGSFQGQQRAQKSFEICNPQFRKYKLSLEQNRSLLSSNEFLATPMSCKKPFSLPEYLQDHQS